MNRFQRIPVLLLLLVAGGMPAVAGAPALRVVGDQDYPPVTYLENGEAQGIHVDIIHALAKVLGREMRVELLDWNLAQQQCLAGQADLVTGMSITDERRKSWDFTIPMWTFAYNLFVRDDNVAIHKVQDLAGRRVGVTAGGLPRRFMEAQPGVTVVIVTNSMDAFERLLRGEIDAAAMDQWVGSYLLEKHRISGVTLAGEPFAKLDAGLAVPKGREALLAELNRGLEILDIQGTMVRIRQQWEPEEMVMVSRGKVKRMVLETALAGTALLVVVMALWVMALRRQLRIRRQTEAALRQARDEAEAANRAKSFFLANMSHEIRTPMNAIMGFADLALESAVDAKQRKQLEIVRSRSNDLLLLINDILDLARIEADHLDLGRETLSPTRIMDEVVQMFMPVAEQKGPRLCLQRAEHVPAQASGDPRRLRQILVNLVGNALKFTDTGAVTLGVDRDPADPGDDALRLHFWVQDTGAGIAADQLDRIFLPFTQAETTTSGDRGGAGLGLTIVQRLVRMMGGRIWVQSAPGQGSTFHVTVRLQPPMPALDATPATAATAAAAVPQWRVLAVEDDPASSVLLSSLLQSAGHTAVMVTRGREALARLAGDDFDLVLLDIKLPDMDGLEVTRAIRDPSSAVRDHRIPIIALTAFAMAGDRERCLQAGANAYMAKPLKPHAVRELITQTMAASTRR